MDQAIDRRNRSGLAALFASMAGAIILAFLIPYSTLQSCSRPRIVFFFIMLGVSAVLTLTGAVVGRIAYQKRKDMLTRFSLIFTVIYALLLVYLLTLLI